MRSGFLSLIGRPNTGKSTLLNSILKEKVAIISNKPQTTRNLVQGIYNEDDTQIVFVDTPGIHKPIDKLGVALNAQAYYSINDVDVLLLVVDASVPYGKGDQFIINKLENVDKPVFLILNKNAKKQFFFLIFACEFCIQMLICLPTKAVYPCKVRQLISRKK